MEKPEKTLLEEIQEDYKKANEKPKRTRKPKVEPKKPSKFWGRVKTWLRIVGLGLFIVGVVLFNQWSAYHTIKPRSPIVFRLPWTIETREPGIFSPVVEAKEPEPAIPDDEKTKEQIINEYSNAEYIRKFHILETTAGNAERGFHKECERRGLTNEFGFDVAHDVCFGTFRESVETVNAWLDKYLAQMEREQAICYYNTGYKIRDCEYLTNFEKL